MSWVIKRQRDFTGGENKLLLPEFMQENQLIQAQNCVATPNGTLETRKGKTKINQTSLGTGGIISVHRYAKENGNKYLVVQHGTTLYSASWDGVSVISSFTSVKTGLNAAKLRSHTWKDNLILSNGVDTPFRFDGSICTDLGGTPPKFDVFNIYAGRIWGRDVTTGFVRFCELEDYDTWPALNVIKVRDGDGDTVTGIASLSGGLVITKNNSAWPLYGTNKDNLQLANAPLLPGVGCVSKDCLLDAGVMLGKDSLYQFNLSSVTAIGDTHKSIIAGLTDAERAASFAQVIPLESRAIMVLGNDTILNLDGKYNSITTWANLKAGCFAVSNATGDPGELLIGDADNGWIYRLGNLTDDDGTAIQTVIQTPYNDQGSTRKKVWRFFQPEIEPITSLDSIVYLMYDVDYSTQAGLLGLDKEIPNVMEWGVDNWNEAVWGTRIKVNDPFWLHGVRGDLISFTVTSTERIKFLGYKTKFREAGPT